MSDKINKTLCDFAFDGETKVIHQFPFDIEKKLPISELFDMVKLEKNLYYMSAEKFNEISHLINGDE